MCQDIEHGQAGSIDTRVLTAGLNKIRTVLGLKYYTVKTQDEVHMLTYLTCKLKILHFERHA